MFIIPVIGSEIACLRKFLAALEEQESENACTNDSENDCYVIAEAESERSALQVLGAHPKNVIAGDECHEHARNKCNPEIFVLAAQVNRGYAEATHGHELVTPAEVIPQNVESFGIQVAPENDGGANGKHWNRKE